MKIKPKLKKKRIVKKRPTRGLLTKTQWEEIEYLWIKGEHTFTQIEKKYGATHDAIAQRSCKGKWRDKKKKFWNQAQKEINHRVLEMFVTAGLPPERLIALISEGANKTTKLQNVKSDIIKFTKTVGQGDKKRKINLKPFVLDKTIQTIDNDTTLKYRELAVRLLDMFPAPKSPVMAEDESVSDIPVVTHIQKVAKKI